jgi:predicted DNA-binding protein (UPF0251 family)
MMREQFVLEDGRRFNTEEEAIKHGKGQVYRRRRPGDKGYRSPREAKDEGKREGTALPSVGASATESMPAAKRLRRRRRRAPKEPAPLTPRQAEAMHMVSEHNGNITKAADAVGISRQAMTKRYKAALGKLGKAAIKKPKTQTLPIDRRGQATVADPAT